MFQKKMSAIKVPHHKNAAGIATEIMTPPDEVLLPLKTSSHGIASNVPLVQPGDHVYLGQLVAGENGKGTAVIHAPVSGTVVSVDDPVFTTNGTGSGIRIKSDGKMEPDPSITVPEVNTLDDFLAALRQSGIVGLGGAAYPLWAKLDAIRKGPIKTVLVNGAECEPFITSDHRTMLECVEDIALGIEMLKKYLKSERFVIGIESNKPDAIALMTERFKDDSAVEVKTLQSVYPQGAKQVFLFNASGIIVKKGERLAKYQTIIMNVSTLAKMGRYFLDGMPLVTKTVTVDGSAVSAPKNLIIPVGTPVKAIAEYVGLKCEPGKIVFGGPMMGKTVPSMDTPIIKATNAVLFFAPEDCSETEAGPCIHCGRCVEACPLNLNPTAFSKAMDLDDEDERAAILSKEQVAVCMTCGSCSFVCPAHRPLAKTNGAAKSFLKKYELAHPKKGGEQ